MFLNCVDLELKCSKTIAVRNLNEVARQVLERGSIFPEHLSRKFWLMQSATFHKVKLLLGNGYGIYLA
jgi:hypothetical protein